MTAANRRRLAPWILRWIVVALIGALLAAWWAWPVGELDALARPEVAVTLAPPAPTPLQPQAPTTRQPSGEPARSAAPVPEDETAAVVAPAPIPRTLDLVLRFVGPDGSSLHVAQAELVLESDGLPPRREMVRDAKFHRLSSVPAVKARLSVTAAGFRHLARELDLQRAELTRKRGEIVERIYLWPTEWIAIRVLTPENEPFEELSAALGLDSKHLFVDAFEARACLDPSSAESWQQAEEDPRLATWHKPHLYQSWSLPGGCVGSLQILCTPRPPLWVGLRVLGEPLGVELLSPGQQEVVFRLNAQSLRGRLARLELRAVDAASRLPLPEARLTLKADTSAHRRPDQADVRATADGRLVLEHIVPGRYELYLTHGEVAHQQRIELAAGERIDLGDVLLGSASAVLVRTVDKNGAPTSAFIEVAPYVREASAEELYPPNLWRLAQGDYRLPMPTVVSIVRARGWDAHGHHTTGALSLGVLLDPAHPPAGALELVVMDPHMVRFGALPVAAVALQVLDELELVVASRATTDRVGEELRGIELIPGRYRARLRAQDGALVREIPFVVAHGPTKIALH